MLVYPSPVLYREVLFGWEIKRSVNIEACGKTIHVKNVTNSANTEVRFVGNVVMLSHTCRIALQRCFTPTEPS